MESLYNRSRPSQEHASSDVQEDIRNSDRLSQDGYLTSHLYIDYLIIRVKVGRMVGQKVGKRQDYYHCGGRSCSNYGRLRHGVRVDLFL